MILKIKIQNKQEGSLHDEVSLFYQSKYYQLRPLSHKLEDIELIVVFLHFCERVGIPKTTINVAFQ